MLKFKLLGGATLLFALFVYTFWMLDQRPTESPRIKKDGPTHPGWMEQWNELKLTGDVVLDSRLLKDARRNAMLSKRDQSNLIDIQELGPYNVGGRIRAMAFDRANTDRILAAGVSGGLWETLDRGATWKPLDDFSINLSIVDITQSPFDDNVWYYCTGESAGNSAGIPGDGIWKSTDGAETFMKLSASDTILFDYTWRIEHSLVDSNTFFVATRSHGLWWSTDGGQSFELLFSHGTNHISDIEVFQDGSMLMGVRTVGIYYSPNGQPNSFTRMLTGLPGSGYRRVEMAYCDSFPDYVYAALENSSGDGLRGFYRSNDRGQTWTEMANPDEEYSFAFPWYCLAVSVNPADSNYVVVGSVRLGFSRNGGLSWGETKNSHADHHIVVWDPVEPERFFNGNDGGMYRYELINLHNNTYDRNTGLNITQFYTGFHFPEGLDVYGGTQDNGTQSTKNAKQNFDHIFGGDGAYCAINQQTPYVAWVSYQNGRIHRTDMAWMDKPDFYNIMGNLDQTGNGQVDDGAWFINPFEINLYDGEQVYFVTRKRLWRSNYGGMEWEPLTNMVAGGDPYCVGISHEPFPTVYLGGTGGVFYRIDDAFYASPGDEVDLRHSLPQAVQSHTVGNLTVHPMYDSVVYAAFTNFSPEPRLYKVVDAKSANPQWIDISGNLPVNVPVNWVQVSRINDSVMAAATDYGLYTTIDGGETWTLESAIPKASIHMIRLRPTDGRLFIFTHGRGMWTAQMPGVWQWPASIDDPKHAAMHLYPNPVADKAWITLPEGVPANYRIFSISGRVVASGRTEGQLDVGHLPSGMYLVEAETNLGKRLVSRMVKK